MFNFLLFKHFLHFCSSNFILLLHINTATVSSANKFKRTPKWKQFFVQYSFDLAVILFYLRSVYVCRVLFKLNMKTSWRRQRQNTFQTHHSFINRPFFFYRHSFRWRFLDDQLHDGWMALATDCEWVGLQIGYFKCFLSPVSVQGHFIYRYKYLKRLCELNFVPKLAW